MARRRSRPGDQNLPEDVKVVRSRLADGSEKAYYYHRLTGRPIEGEPGTRAFDLSYMAAAVPKAAAPQRQLDLAWLIEKYQVSEDWRQLAKATQETRRSYFKRIAKRFPNAPLVHFDNEEIVGVLYEWRDEVAAEVSPFSADKHLDALRAVLTWAQKRRMVKINWAKGIDRLVPLSRNRSQLVWTPELWATLYEAAEQDERDLLDFASFTAAREADIAAMRSEWFDGKWLVYTPQKTANRTGVVVHLPVYALPPFAALLERLGRSSEYLLTTRTGQPWTASNIKLRMRALKARAFPDGDPGRTFHDIRGTTISRLYTAGCTDAEVASIDGHAIGRGTMLGRYAERNRQLAINAFERWTAAEFSERGIVIPFQRA